MCGVFTAFAASHILTFHLPLSFRSSSWIAMSVIVFLTWREGIKTLYKEKRIMRFIAPKMNVSKRNGKQKINLYKE